MTDWFFIIAGVLGLLYVALRILGILYNVLAPYVFLRPINLKKRAGASWAVVTGATDGIGKAYCFELAARGFNVLLVSRTQSRLDSTKKEILEKHANVEVRTAAYDFTDATTAGYKNLLAKLNEVDVGILVNNVGMYYDYPDLSHKINFDTNRDMTVVNSLPPTLLSAGILPQMVSRKAGVIINIGSVAGIRQMATWATYSATKKYVSWLTAILRKEYEHQGITIQNITPGMVATKMAGNPDTSFSVPDVTKFAKSALNTVGLAGETTGYIGHQIEAEMIAILPTFILDRAITQKSAELREKALAKKENQLLS